MEQAKAGLTRLRNAKENLNYLINKGEGELSESEKSRLKTFDNYRDQFITAMDDDLNTADGISAIFELVTAINTAVIDGCSKEFAEKSKDILMELCNVLGILQNEVEEDIDEVVKALIEERQKARKDKDFKRADEIRDILKEKGIALKDTPNGVQIVRI
jgi:cysteinyl-tRNA synthetase